METTVPIKKQRREDNSYSVSSPIGYQAFAEGESCHEELHSEIQGSQPTSAVISPESTPENLMDDHSYNQMVEYENGNEEHYGRNSGSRCKQITVLKREDSLASTTSARFPAMEYKSPSTRFSDIIGHGDVKIRIDELLLPLALPTSVTDNILRGVRSLPASVLLYGPPGCGKTQLARAIAGETQAAFLSIGPSDILSKFVGESESSLRELFKQARNFAGQVESRCCVIFFDEIDALGISRGGLNENSNSQDGDGSRRILAELLIQLTKLSNSDENSKENHDDDATADETVQESCDKERVLVVAATNRLVDCDPALIRRFAIQIHVGLPKARDRRKILKKFLLDFDHSISKTDLSELSDLTESWSGSDLETLAREAAMTPIRECLKAASAMRRKTRRMQRQRVAESSQETSKTKDALEVAKVYLLERFKKLRPVTLSDFLSAMNFLTCDAENGSYNNQYNSQYDSSSDSDGDKEG